MITRSLLVGGLAFLLAACTTTTYTVNGRPSTDGKPPESRIFALYRITIDREAVSEGAPLFFTEPPAGREYGHGRKAGGQISIGDTGLIACRVGVAETNIGLHGKLESYGYRLLDFRGRLSKEGNRATIAEGEVVVDPPPGVVDEIRIEKTSDDKISIQAWVSGQRQSYVYHFTRSRISSKPNVDVPWR